jgi:hypothetical protein
MVQEPSSFFILLVFPDLPFSLSTGLKYLYAKRSLSRGDEILLQQSEGAFGLCKDRQ